MLPRTFLAAWIALSLLPLSEAQGVRPRGDIPPGKNFKPKTEPFMAEGTVQAVLPPRIRMLADSGQQWIVIVDPKATVHVIGTAEPDFLRPGMFIRFTAEIDKRGTVKEKLRRLTIFTPSSKDPVGAWPETKGPAGSKQAKGKPRFGEGSGSEPAAATAPTSAVYSIAGRITRCHKGGLTVRVGRNAVQVQLAEEPEIGVDFADYSVAKQGDRISVTKGKMFAGRIGLAQAQELTIKLSKPLTLAKKKPARTKPPAAKRPHDKAKKADPGPEPSGEQKQAKP